MERRSPSWSWAWPSWSRSLRIPADSAWRNAEGVITNFNSPIMRSIVTLIFLLFLIPGIVYGLVAGTIKTSKDMIDGMTNAMHSQMAYYLVIMFFIAQFVYAFNVSNLGRPDGPGGCAQAAQGPGPAFGK